jgi:hypothetical protein
MNITDDVTTLRIEFTLGQSGLAIVPAGCLGSNQLRFGARASVNSTIVSTHEVSRKEVSS